MCIYSYFYCFVQLKIDEEMATSSNEEEQEDTEDELRQKFIEEIIKAGFERTIAVKALESVKPDQVDEGNFLFRSILYKSLLLFNRSCETGFVKLSIFYVWYTILLPFKRRALFQRNNETEVPLPFQSN